MRVLSYFEIMFVLFLMVAEPVLAQMSNKCLNNLTIQRKLNFTFRTDTSHKNLTITKQEDCQFGCDNVTNECSPNPVTLNLVFGSGLLGLLLVIGLIVRQMRRM